MATYYDLLHIPKNASQLEIKKAFHKIALISHPDKGGDPEKFKEINNAYNVLSDPEKRKQYDQFGENFEEKGMNGMSGGMNMEDILRGMMGNGNRENMRKKCQDVQHIIKISLKEVYNGTTKKLKIHRTLICQICEGFGTKDKTESKCTCNNGQRVIVRQIGPGMIQQMTVVCNDCKGSGSRVMNDNKCDMCNGTQVINDENIVPVNIQKGIEHGHILKFPGEANQKRNFESGDLLIQVQIDPSLTTFKYQQNNLILHKTINLAEALSGFSFVVEHLDERKLYIKSSSIITPNQMLMIKDEGLPIKNSHLNGDLIIHFNIEFPNKINHPEILPKIFNQDIQEEKENEEYTISELQPIDDKKPIVTNNSDEDNNVQQCKQQ